MLIFTLLTTETSNKKEITMTMEQPLFLNEQIDEDVKEDYFYETWHVDTKKVSIYEQRYRKNYGRGRKDVKKALEIMLHNEMGNPCFPHVLRTGVGVIDWLHQKTIPEPIMKSNITIKVMPKKGEQVHFADEGTFVVKACGSYEEYPWVLLTSMVNGYDIIMSLRALNHRLLRNGSLNKNLNFMITNQVNDPCRYWYTIGYLLKNKSCLSIRTTPTTHDRVVTLYKKITGTDIGIKRYVQYNPNLKTFTDNASLSIGVIDPLFRNFLYFPKNKIGKRDGVIRGDMEYIHNTEYVWTLFNYGFYLGDTHNIDKIREFVYINANKFYKDFEKGYYA